MPTSASRSRATSQQGLREDLKILVMSATIDGARVAALLGNAPVIESQGRAFPVETRYLGRDPRARIEDQMADAVTRALRAEPGSVLAFLPGAAEIRRTETLLKERVEANTDVVALLRRARCRHAGPRDLARAGGPAQGRARDVDRRDLAHDRRRAHRGRFRACARAALRAGRRPDAARNRARLARRRRPAPRPRRTHRAGRLRIGCGTSRRPPRSKPYARPEILSADLSGFVLDLAAWGAAPETLAFLDPPPKGALAEARALLTELGALDDGRITEEGQALRRLPLPPRLARMVVDAAREGAGALAADIAAVLTERGLGGDDVDLTHRVENFRRDRSPRARDARAMAKRWNDLARSAPSPQGGGETRDLSIGSVLVLAYPDRIAKNRGNGAFTLANGRGGHVDQASPLAREPFIAVAELTGGAANARIVLAAPITLEEIEARFADRIENRDEVTFDEKSLSLRARRSRRLGAIALTEQTRKVEPNDETARALAEGIARVGVAKLPWTKALTQWRDRVMFLRKAEGDEWPDLSDAGTGCEHRLADRAVRREDGGVGRVAR